MREIQLLSSNLDLDLELLDGIKRRTLDQKFLYQGEGAEMYYRCRRLGISKSGLNESLFTLPEMETLKGKKVALVYLFCSRDYLDLQMLDDMNARGYQIDFFGVDMSMSIIEAFIKDQPKNIKTRCQFFWADFTSYYFRELRESYLGSYDVRIYVLPDGIVGNLNQSYIVDTLYNILSKNDLLWLDVVLRKGIRAENDIETFDYYASCLDKKLMRDFFFWPLRGLGLSEGNGRLTLQMTKEAVTGAIRFGYGFLMEKKTILRFRDERIVFLPGENISLLDIRTYDEKILADFFAEHDFTILNYRKETIMGQFFLKRAK